MTRKVEGHEWDKESMKYKPIEWEWNEELILKLLALGTGNYDKEAIKKLLERYKFATIDNKFFGGEHDVVWIRRLKKEIA